MGYEGCNPHPPLKLKKIRKKRKKKKRERKNKKKKIVNQHRPNYKVLENVLAVFVLMSKMI